MLSNKHPSYSLYVGKWQKMRDCYAGEEQIKDRGIVYLPATSGMELDGMGEGQIGKKAYNAYLLRSVFHNFIQEAVAAYSGLMHRESPSIELPPEMEPLRERASISGESLELFLRRINIEQLTVGRVGILADLPEVVNTENPLPYLVTYVAERVNNWDDGTFQDGVNALNLVVLNETGWIRENFAWREQAKYRVLQLGVLNQNEVDGTAAYLQGTFKNEAYDEGSLLAPTFRGVSLKEIPFVFVNTKDNLTQPDEPPLLSLANLALAIYRAEADYRQNLYLQSQDTLVISGAVLNNNLPGEGQPDAIRVGAGSRINLDLGGKAEFIGVSANGLSEQRQSLAADKAAATIKAGQMLSPTASTQESGQALKTRIGAQTATLTQVALAGASALQKILRIVAVWMGLDPEKVIVKPNLEFTDYEISGQDLVFLMTARSLGLPLSIESLHALMVERGITEMEFAEELAKWKAEGVIQPPSNVQNKSGIDGNAQKPTAAPVAS